MEQTNNSNTSQEQYMLDFTGDEVNRLLHKVDNTEEIAPLSEKEIQTIMT